MDAGRIHLRPRRKGMLAVRRMKSGFRLARRVENLPVNARQISNSAPAPPARRLRPAVLTVRPGKVAVHPMETCPTAAESNNDPNRSEASGRRRSPSARHRSGSRLDGTAPLRPRSRSVHKTVVGPFRLAARGSWFAVRRSRSGSFEPVISSPTRDASELHARYVPARNVTRSVGLPLAIGSNAASPDA